MGNVGSWGFSQTDKILFVIVVSMAGVAIVLGVIRIWMHKKYGPYESTTSGDWKQREIDLESGAKRSKSVAELADPADMDSGSTLTESGANYPSTSADVTMRTSCQQNRSPMPQRKSWQKVDAMLAAIGAFDDEFCGSHETIEGDTVADADSVVGGRRGTSTCRAGCSAENRRSVTAELAV